MKSISKKIRKKKKYTVCILHHSLKDNDPQKYFSKEHVVVDSQTSDIVEYMEKVFLEKGYRVQSISVEPEDVSNLKKLKADVVFNLVDSRAMEIRILKMLERMRISFSGSPLEAIRISNNKIKSKLIMDKHHIPTPKFSYIRPSDRLTRSKVPGKFPVIIKPAFEHCSIGITEKSIATNYVQFRKIVQKLRRKFRQTLIAEEFIRGLEIQVTVLESNNTTVALPIAEMGFRNGNVNKWNIFGFDEKWDEKSKYYDSCYFTSPPLNIRPHITRKIQRDAIRAFYAFKFKDYARFDLRYDPKTQRWYFLEGNANAGFCINPDDAMTASINAYGLTLKDFIVQIAKNSLPH